MLLINNSVEGLRDFLAFGRWRENQLIKLIKFAQLIKCAENICAEKRVPHRPPSIIKRTMAEDTLEIVCKYMYCSKSDKKYNALNLVSYHAGFSRMYTAVNGIYPDTIAVHVLEYGGPGLDRTL